MSRMTTAANDFGLPREKRSARAGAATANMNAQTGRIGDQGESQDESQGEHRPVPQAAGGKKHKRDVHGWLVLDKPVGMTSTHAVSVIKHLFAARRAGHAGTLDPLASGCLPIAL